MLNLKDPVTNIPHVGPTYAELLAQLSINHIETSEGIIERERR